MGTLLVVTKYLISSHALSFTVQGFLLLEIFFGVQFLIIIYLVRRTRNYLYSMYNNLFVQQGELKKQQMFVQGDLEGEHREHQAHIWEEDDQTTSRQSACF